MSHAARLIAIGYRVLWVVAARSQSPLNMIPFHMVLFWATRAPLEAESSPERDMKAHKITVQRQ